MVGTGADQDAGAVDESCHDDGGGRIDFAATEVRCPAPVIDASRRCFCAGLPLFLRFDQRPAPVRIAVLLPGSESFGRPIRVGTPQPPAASGRNTDRENDPARSRLQAHNRQHFSTIQFLVARHLTNCQHNQLKGPIKTPQPHALVQQRPFDLFSFSFSREQQLKKSLSVCVCVFWDRCYSNPLVPYDLECSNNPTLILYHSNQMLHHEREINNGHNLLVSVADIQVE